MEFLEQLRRDVPFSKSLIDLDSGKVYAIKQYSDIITVWMLKDGQFLEVEEFYRSESSNWLEEILAYTGLNRYDKIFIIERVYPW